MDETVENCDGAENSASLQPATVSGMLAEGPGLPRHRQRTSLLTAQQAACGATHLSVPLTPKSYEVMHTGAGRRRR